MTASEKQNKLRLILGDTMYTDLSLTEESI